MKTPATIVNREFLYVFGVVALLAVTVCLVIFTCCRSPVAGMSDIISTLNNYNLILVNIDALRADHVGCYGYDRNTSPFINSLAAEGIIFERALSNSSYTRESVAVLLSGKLPSSGNTVGWNAKPSKSIANMGELFSDAGYKTAFFSDTNMLQHPNFTSGFQEIYHLKKWGVSGNGLQLSVRAGEFIKRCNGKKFMIYLHYLDPHGPYNPPDELYLRFAESLYPNPLDLYRYVRQNIVSLVKDGFGPGDVRFEDMVTRYDAEIAHTDQSIELLFTHLDNLNLLKNTLVVITADHGEEFLEHGYVEHAWTLYNESLHIPFIVWAPAVIAPKRIAELVSTVDMLPTILAIMAIPHTRSDFDGNCLFTRKGKGFRFTPPDKPFIAELLIQHRNIIRAVIQDDWKYIAALKWLQTQDRAGALSQMKQIEGNKASHLDIWNTVVHEELYNLSKDPQEKNNLVDAGVKSRLGEIIEEYKNYCRQQGIQDSPDTDKDPPLSEDDIGKLKSLGYF